MNKQESTEALLTAAHNYQSDMSKWNGDEDGPAERAEERLGDAIDTVIKNLLDNA